MGGVRHIITLCASIRFSVCAMAIRSLIAPIINPKRRKTMRITEFKIEYVDFIPPVEAMKEGVLYISRPYMTTSHLCACGCGNEVVLPYGRRDGMFWTLTERLSGVTIRPSVGSFNLPCKSHYYITDNKIEWLC